MKRYEIWSAKVKFEDSDKIKERPVLIWDDQCFLIAFKMTGTDRGDDREEYRIRYWREAGLDKPTSIRLRKLLKLEKDDFIYKIGELDKRERLLFYPQAVNSISLKIRTGTWRRMISMLCSKFRSITEFSMPYRPA